MEAWEDTYALLLVTEIMFTWSQEIMFMAVLRHWVRINPTRGVDVFKSVLMPCADSRQRTLLLLKTFVVD